MTMKRDTRRSPLALAILSLLVEAPMHPYRMQQLIKQRVKDDVINVRLRASLYQTIDRLLRAELIAVHEIARTEHRPERTSYRITDRGEETARRWMLDMLATPAREFPEFPAALAHLPLLAPDDVLQQLEHRARALQEQIADAEARLRLNASFLPRLFVVEAEYQQAIRQAEASWVRALIEDLRAGRLTWNDAWLVEVATRLSPLPVPVKEESQ